MRHTNIHEDDSVECGQSVIKSGPSHTHCSKHVKSWTQIASDCSKMGLIWDLLMAFLVHFGSSPRMSNLDPKWVRLIQKETNLQLFLIRIQKSDLKMFQICPNWHHTAPLWAQIWLLFCSPRQNIVKT